MQHYCKPSSALTTAAIAAAGCLTLFPAVVNADESPEAIVVTASRLDQSIDELSQSVEVITRDEIERLWASSAAEVLRQVPGTNVIQQGGRGGGGTILLRGGEPNFTVVLIDGIQVNDPTNSRGGSYDISSLEQAQVDNVELVFGTMSPVYGSDALSGVVNFITRGAESGSSVAAEVGTQGYGSLSGFYGDTLGKVDVGVGVYATDDEGDVEGSDYSARGLNGKLGTEFADSGIAGLSFGYQTTESTSFPEDSGGPELAVIRDVDERDADEYRVGLNLGYTFADRWKTGLLANYYRREDSYTSPGIAPSEFLFVPPNAADTDFSRKQVLATLSTDFGEALAVLVGAEWQNENGSSVGVLEFPPEFGGETPTDFDLDRDTVSAFAEASYEIGRVVLQGGLRYDDPDGIDSETTGRLGIIVRAPGNVEFRGNWGNGFKAPSFFALAFPVTINPEGLLPEKAESIDVGVKHSFLDSSGMVEFILFRNEYQDLIDFDNDLFYNVNRDEVITKGAEAAVEYAPVATFNIRAHLTYLDTEIVGSDEPLRGRPEWRGGLVADWEFIRSWRWVTSILSLDDFYESSVPTGDILLDGYTRVDTSVTWQATEALSLGLAVDNLLDKDYQEAVGFPAAGIRGRLGAKYKF